MPRIRDYESDQRATGPLSSGGATSAAFGGQIGQALQGAGDALSVAARATHDTRADEIDASLRAAKIKQEMTTEYYRMQTTTQPGAQNFARDVGSTYDKISQKAMDGASAGAAKAAQVKLANMKTEFFDNATGFEAKSGASKIRNDAQETLKTFQNIVTLNPAEYENAVRDGGALIDKLIATPDAKGLPGDMAVELKRNYVEQVTFDYFEGKIRGAKSAADIDATLTEMADPKFTERLDPKNTATLVSNARTMQHTIGTQATTAARAAVTSLKDRMEAGDKIDPVEISNADEAVRTSANPGVLNDWEKLKAGHRATLQARQLPKDVVDQSLLDEHGLPSKRGVTRFQNLPAELNDAIEGGVAITGGKISADFIARSMVRESGSDIAKLRRGNAQFAPVAAHAGVNIEGIRPAVRDAAAVAGQIFGEPLKLNSGFRSQEKQDAIRGGRDVVSVARHSHHTSGSALDIDTAGWAPDRKAKLVDSLIQAGFTGFGEYDGHIHADFRSNVPASFDAKMLFGGWTKLSPEVMETLTKRGFGAGAAAGKVNRLDAEGKVFSGAKLNFDFGSGNHPDGRPSSSARGPLQFIEGTWMEYLPQAAKAYGINIEGKSQQELLAMRADPKIATQVYAFYSLQNKKVMEAHLKREVNESELYMGHLMGATGASVFLKAWTVQPQTAVADVLSPAAIEANKSVFLNKDGTSKTVAQVYAEIGAGFNNGIDALGHERAKALHKVQGEMAALNKPHGDPMSYSMKYGASRPVDLGDPTSFAIRGEQSLRQEDYYKLDFPKPLTNDEAADYRKKIEDGDVAAAVQALQDIGRFGGRASEGAAKQLGEHSNFTSHVAGLFAKGGAEAQVAEDVIRGKRMLRDNSGAKDWLGSGGEGGTGRKFDAYVGNAFDGLDPKARAAAKEAADAYYVQKFASRGDGAFNDTQYKQAIDATLGNRLGTVNGEKTVVPLGVTGEQFDDAINNLTPADLTGLSVSGDAPVDASGRPLFAHQIAVEGKFVHLGGDEYAVRMGDGKFAITGELTPARTFAPYRMRIDGKTVVNMLGRESATAPRGVDSIGALSP